MRIAGQFTADLRKFQITANQERDGREALVDFDIGLDEDDAATACGGDFAKLAFGSTTSREGETTHLQDSIKPGKKVVWELHKIEIAGETVEAQPELRTLKPVDGERRVVASFRIPIPVDKSKPLRALVDKVGQNISVEFNPAQQVLPLGDPKPFDGDQAAAH
jgi:hypothetical protein